MKLLDIDLDYFLKTEIGNGNGSSLSRLSEKSYGSYVWSEKEVRSFFENNLGLSKEFKISGRVVTHHNESLFFWRELINKGMLDTPFEVIHIDSHADLGLGNSSWSYFYKEMLKYPVKERPFHTKYSHGDKDFSEDIGDYLLYAVAYQWVSHITYCGNPNKQCFDYVVNTLKNFEEIIPEKNGSPVLNTIQLLYNPEDFPSKDIDKRIDRLNQINYISNSVKEPEVPFLIIPRIEDVKFDGNFEYATIAQSPGYTPASADFILDIFREYITEI